MSDTTLYWAYGSNLNVQAMKVRCPAAKKYKPLYVPNGRLMFRGVADVEAVDEKGSMIAGGLWKVTKRCIEALDRYEGVISGLYAKKHLKLLVSGESTTCLYYQMNSVGVMPPSVGYADVIERGYRDFDLDLDYLYEAIHRSLGEEFNKTPDLRRRWIAKGKPRLVGRKR